MARSTKSTPIPLGFRLPAGIERKAQRLLQEAYAIARLDEGIDKSPETRKQDNIQRQEDFRQQKLSDFTEALAALGKAVVMNHPEVSEPTTFRRKGEPMEAFELRLGAAIVQLVNAEQLAGQSKPDVRSGVILSELSGSLTLTL